MKYALTTTAKEVVEPQSYTRIMRFSAGNFSTAVSVSVRFPGTLNVIFILNAAGVTHALLEVPAGRRLEAYTDAGTADLSVIKESR